MKLRKALPWKNPTLRHQQVNLIFKGLTILRKAVFVRLLDQNRTEQTKLKRKIMRAKTPLREMKPTLKILPHKVFKAQRLIKKDYVQVKLWLKRLMI